MSLKYNDAKLVVGQISPISSVKTFPAVIFFINPLFELHAGHFLILGQHRLQTQ